jgi:hypothetical protein
MDTEKAELMRSLNEGIALVASSVPADPEGSFLWEFACECGARNCRAWVELDLSHYRELRDDSRRRVLASGHVARARRARAAAESLQAETQALRAQAQQQLRRAKLLRRDR